MIKIDFHIHTMAVPPWDREFEYIDKRLKDYVSYNSLDCIAITNHNRFFEEQYYSIQKLLPGISVFPGMEINVLNGHVLVVGSENDVDSMVSISKQLEDLLITNEDYLSIQDFQNLVKGKDFLIIPHYDKSKALSYSNIINIDSNIYVGEVGNPKKFLAMKHNDNELFTPVLFSDIRCSAPYEEGKKEHSHETRYTYVKIDTTNFKAICTALKGKGNVGVSPFEDETFDVLNGDVRAHKGINVVLGKRSTGKSYLLDNIYKSFRAEGKVLYIKQFELAKNSENTEFDKIKTKSSKAEVKAYCEDLNEFLLEISNKAYTGKKYDIDAYLSSIKKYADDNSLFNAFSKMKLFNHKELRKDNVNKDEIIVSALATILDVDDERKQIIEKSLSINSLLSLLSTFIQRAKDKDYNDVTIEEANEISRIISRELAMESPVEPVTPIDFCDIYELLYIQGKTNELLNGIKPKEIVDVKVSDKFHHKVRIFKPTYSNKNTYKNETGHERRECFKDEDLFNAFIHQAKELQLESGDDELFSYFVGNETTITSNGDKELSGGEKAEYILIEKLQNYENYDIVLIDEMESSFDNQYLNHFINNLLHKIASKCTVFISTHNNNLGVSLNPDYYIYHEYEYDGITEKYLRFYGSSTSNELSMKDGTSKNLKTLLLETMEASLEAYDDRKGHYEISAN